MRVVATWEIMLQEEVAQPRHHLLSRRSFKQRSRERDDRGWTLLHIGARKGDLREVGDLGFFSILLISFFRLSYFKKLVYLMLLRICGFVTDDNL